MPKVNEGSLYHPNGIWETPFCKHCGREAKSEYLLGDHNTYYEKRCDCETVSLMADNLQEQVILEHKIEQIRQENLKLSRTYSKQYKKWYVKEALREAARSVGLDNFEKITGTVFPLIDE